MNSDPPSTGTADQRRESRRLSEATVTMRFDAAPITGSADNLSSVGLMFFTDTPMRVTIEFDEEGKRRTVGGRLVRVQRMNETNTGIAIEFDDAL